MFTALIKGMILRFTAGCSLKAFHFTAIKALLLCKTPGDLLPVLPFFPFPGIAACRRMVGYFMKFIAQAAVAVPRTPRVVAKAARIICCIFFKIEIDLLYRRSMFNKFRHVIPSCKYCTFRL